MLKTFLMAMDKLQPSQLYINAEKLEESKKSRTADNTGEFAPIPVKKLDDDIIITDGYTRALIGHLEGLKYVSVYWDEDELDREAYAVCVEWCKQEGIRTIAYLGHRIVEPDAYKALWLERCKAIHQGRQQKSAHGDRSL